MQVSLTGLAAMAVLMCTALLVGRAWTHSRRHSFLLERFFEEALRVQVNAGRHADSILNHTLKNTMADAAGSIELFLERRQNRGESEVHLQHAAAALRRGMRSCRNRQAYLHLVAGNYVVSLQRLNLKEWVTDLTTGRDVQLEVPDQVTCNATGVLWEAEVS